MASATPRQSLPSELANDGETGIATTEPFESRQESFQKYTHVKNSRLPRDRGTHIIQLLSCLCCTAGHVPSHVMTADPRDEEQGTKWLAQSRATLPRFGATTTFESLRFPLTRAHIAEFSGPDIHFLTNYGKQHEFFLPGPSHWEGFDTACNEPAIKNCCEEKCSWFPLGHASFAFRPVCSHGRERSLPPPASRFVAAST